MRAPHKSRCRESSEHLLIQHGCPSSSRVQIQGKQRAPIHPPWLPELLSSPDAGEAASTSSSAMAAQAPHESRCRGSSDHLLIRHGCPCLPTCPCLPARCSLPPPQATSSLRRLGSTCAPPRTPRVAARQLQQRCDRQRHPLQPPLLAEQDAMCETAAAHLLAARDGRASGSGETAAAHPHPAAVNPALPRIRLRGLIHRLRHSSRSRGGRPTALRSAGDRSAERRS